MSHKVHITLGVSYHGNVVAQSSIHLGVLLESYKVLGTA
jgi:hypothetical protein